MFDFLTQSLLFIIFLVTCIYGPGKFLTMTIQLPLSALEDIFYSTVLGLVLYTLLAYIFAFAHISIVLYLLIAGLDIIVARNFKQLVTPISKIHYKPLLLVLVFSLVFSMSDLLFGQNGTMINLRNDDLWHLALTNELKVNFPPDFPTLAHVPLTGYHFFYNFVAAQASNFFGITPVNVLFRFLPLLDALLWGLGIYTFVYFWDKRISASLWAVFFAMFGGSFAYFLYLHEAKVNLESGFVMNQPTEAIYNPPYAISIVILLAAFLTIGKYLRSETNTQRNKWLISLCLLVGMITMFKVYAGILVIGATVVFVGYELLFKRRILPLLALVGIGLIFLGTYWVFVGPSGKLIFFPYWPVAAMLRSFPWYGYDEKIYTYTKMHVLHGLIETQVYGFILYFFGNLGTRLIGILTLIAIAIKKRQKMSFLSFLLMGTAAVAFFIPLFFIQSGQVFEIIQLAEYFLFIVALFAGRGFADLFNLHFSKYVKAFLFAIILILTLPSAYYTASYMIAGAADYRLLTSAENAPYTFLSSQGSYEDTVLALPPLTDTTSKQLFAWFSSTNTQLPALANKRAFLSYGSNAIPAATLSQKLAALEKIMDLIRHKNNQQLLKTLKEQQIKYIYSPVPVETLQKTKFIKRIYYSPTATIYEVLAK
jgi:hypothetical protein